MWYNNSIECTTDNSKQEIISAVRVIEKLLNKYVIFVSTQSGYYINKSYMKSRTERVCGFTEVKPTFMIEKSLEGRIFNMSNFIANSIFKTCWNNLEKIHCGN